MEPRPSTDRHKELKGLREVRILMNKHKQEQQC